MIGRVGLGLAALVLLGAGCGSVTEPQPTAVLAAVQGDVVVPGSAVAVHLVNTHASSWTVAPCPLHLQRADGSRWRSVRLPACTEEAVLLDGGEPLVAELEVPFGSEPGVYRVVYGSWLVPPGQSLVASEQVLVHSNRFYVPAFR